MSKVSIIIPVYNAEKFLKKCLDSIIEQTYENIEIICVNDGSKDGSLNILKEYQEKDFRIVVINKENAGVSEARNDGIKKSTGEYVMFADADDWLEKDAVEIMYNALQEKKVDVVRGNYYINTSYEQSELQGNMCGLNDLVLKTDDKEFVKKVHKNLLKGNLLCYVWALLIKKDVILKTSLFKKGIVMMEDSIFYNELMNVIDSIYFLDKPMYHYYYNPSSCTKSSEYYVRNMYNLLKVHKILVDGIEKDKFEEAGRISEINTTISNKIAGYFFLMYLANDKSKMELIKLMDELLADKYLKELFENVEYKSLDTHLIIPIKLMLKKKYNTLFLFYKFRKIMRTAKNKLK